VAELMTKANHVLLLLADWVIESAKKNVAKTNSYIKFLTVFPTPCIHQFRNEDLSYSIECYA
jgi:hypothetical protein